MMSERSTTGVPSEPPLTSSTVRFVQDLKRPKNLRPAAADDSGAVHTALSTDGGGYELLPGALASTPAVGDALSTASSESEDTSMAAPSCSIGYGPVGPEKQRKSDDGEKSKWLQQRQLFERI